MLIAMMSNTYTRIEERSNIEWKYGRARTIYNMAESDSTPSPVNLFTTVTRVLRYGTVWYLYFTMGTVKTLKR